MTESFENYYKKAKAVEVLENQRTGWTRIPNMEDFLDYISDNGFSIAGEGILKSMINDIYEARRENNVIPALGKEVLDIGCGTSYFYRCLFSDGKWNGTVTPMDLSEDMIKKAKERLELFFKQLDLRDDGNFVRFTDYAGRENISPSRNFAVPAPNIRAASIMAERYKIGNILEDDIGQYETITGFSGPLCFYPKTKQEKIAKKLAKNATKSIILDLKSPVHEYIKRDQDALRYLGNVCFSLFGTENHEKIKEDFTKFDMKGLSEEIVKSKLFTKLDYEVEHHGGPFCYCTTDKEWFEGLLSDNGFSLKTSEGYGFMTELCAPFLLEKYKDCDGDPKKLKDFYRRLKTIENEFCNKTDFAENMQMVFYRRQEIPENGYSHKNMDYRTILSGDFAIIKK